MYKSLIILGAVVASGIGFHFFRSQGPQEDEWTSRFHLELDELTSVGGNPYFSLIPGYTLRLEDGSEVLIITVLDETRMVDGVETRIVEERESDDGELVELSRNFYAISRRTNSVYYFGEEVDVYRDGQIVDHEGAWESGREGARFGLMMPGVPLLRGRYYQEIAPGAAMDRAEIVSLTESLVTPAGEFEDVLVVEETTPLEPGVREYKYFAPGIGLLQDGSLKLVSFGGGDRSDPDSSGEATRKRGQGGTE